jgi:hypothetical protein
MCTHVKALLGIKIFLMNGIIEFVGHEIKLVGYAIKFVGILI